MEWNEDKEKNGEVFANSFCFTYCLKCFQAEKRVELWKRGEGYKKTYQTLAGAMFDYQQIKTFNCDELLVYLDTHFKQIKR